MTFIDLVTLASWRGFMLGLLVTMFVLICLLLIGVVLLQKGRGGGLSSAFGGAGGASPFGTKTGDVFTWITVVLAALFLLVAAVLDRTYLPKKAQPTAGEMAPVKGQATPGAKGPGTSLPDSLEKPGKSE